MKKITLLLLIFLGASKLFAQRGHAVRIDLSIHSEVDNLFPGVRKQAVNTYVFNRGLGIHVRYGHDITRKFWIGAATGVMYFVNNSNNTDAFSREYKTRNMVTPILGMIEYDLLQTDRNHIGFVFKAGTGYLQNIHKLNDHSVRVATSWTGVFEFTIYMHFGMKNGRFLIPPAAYGRTIIDKKPFHSGYCTVHTFWL